MKLVEVQNQIFSFYLSNDTFFVEKDIKRVKVSDNQEKIKRELVIAVLEHMAQDGFCVRVSTGDVLTGDCYVLAVPFGSEGQNIEISNNTAELIAEFLTQFMSANDIKDYAIDKFNIKEQDLQNLIAICTQLLSTQDKGE